MKIKISLNNACIALADSGKILCFEVHKDFKNGSSTCLHEYTSESNQKIDISPMWKALIGFGSGRPQSRNYYFLDQKYFLL